MKAEKEKERRLENAIHELKKEREQEKRRPTVGAPAPTSTTSSAPSSSSERSSCGDELEVGPDTTCAFAENVRAEYEYEFGSGSGEITAYSEANNRYYSMYCTAAPRMHECDQCQGLLSLGTRICWRITHLT
jgi:hypothetical protein